MGEKDEAVAYLEGISYKKAESPESQLVQAQVLELLSEYHEDMKTGRRFVASCIDGIRFWSCTIPFMITGVSSGVEKIQESKISAGD